jgi:arabinogalactan endo-1,4-beta-galactosidase
MKYSIYILLFLSLFSCSKNQETISLIIAEDTFIRAADISFLPEIESTATVFYNNSNVAENALTTLKNSGCNTIRIRLWKDPINGKSGFAEVKTFAQRVKAAGMKVWLTVHFSDTWADPGQQITPVLWNPLDFNTLKSIVVSYTSTILTEIKPDIFQIGNETNDGFLYPIGKLSTNENQFLQLVQTVSTTIRNQSSNTKIMLHYAGIGAGATYFFNKVSAINYDYIGISYYPMWHGKSLVEVKNTINNLGQTHNKKVIIAETSYPFTFGYNDWTNNIIGDATQIIPQYPATADGQKNYMLAIKTLIKETTFGQGFCYWGGEWISFRGAQATNGSSYENQALWDFNNKALPVMSVFAN